MEHFELLPPSMGYASPRNNSSRSWPSRVILGFFFTLFVTAAPRITRMTELRLGHPAFFKQDGWAVSGPSLFRTVDGGWNWKPVKINGGGRETSADIRGTYFASAKAAWITLAQGDQLGDRLGPASAFVSTHDGGATWRAESLPNVEWFFESFFGTGDPKGPLWLGGQVSHQGDAPAEDMDCPQRVKGFTWTPAIYFRSVPGSAWEEQPIPVQNGCPVSTIRFLDNLRGIAIAGTAIVFSEDGGKHWKRSVIRASTKVHPPVSVQFRGREGWIGCDHGEILHTVDGGQHWEEIVAAGAIWSKARGFGSWGAVYFMSAEAGFMLGGDGELFMTRDHAKTWSKIATPERIINLSCAGNQCWLISSDKLYRIEER